MGDDGKPHAVPSEVQDGRKLSYPDDSFDAAFSVSVIEHIPDQGDTAAVRELLRVVKPGGVVIITTPYDTAYRPWMRRCSVSGTTMTLRSACGSAAFPVRPS